MTASVGSVAYPPAPFPHGCLASLSKCTHGPVSQLLKPLQWVLVASEQSPSRLDAVSGTVHPGPPREACQAPPITQSLSSQSLQEPSLATQPRWSGSETLPLGLTPS